MEPLSKFSYEGFEVTTFYNGSGQIPFVATYMGVELIRDKFKPSPLYNIDGTDAMCALLGFLMLQYGAVEEGYFVSRDAPLMDEFANNSPLADDIRMMLYDYELRDDERYLKDNEIDYDFCTRIGVHIENLLSCT